ncbi:hypothetical protein C5E07_05595 [Pseudoclavibacter sp. RFBJ3]|uniref:DUF7455 domain-containing protein n=1 Tax=unclassified Pseudoclavibacter TaxID=2615177 RepID=UPI000CE888F9|nr:MULTISPECIES: hypothetical protein [unclassified Pseudoclavibacter]MBF4549193.1 hypothetical protein [Pseudoclavibacter sp. VKM Ac-2888]PPF40060.1 hypothetical protein C5E05_02280 [Pseudoclavibacter sp. AY1H1]PPF75938.1 hypothetical protein C5B99_08710 [Pseudoclavibacter sp. Z016]PPF84968.1 hypothetical protein C5C12_06300 [Pseudoclavibacter sp. RFBJ5]PPF93972.1 hypothetical protein C5E07_05595 [Pseudoclavibacter sp. RFBJ3]
MTESTTALRTDSAPIAATDRCDACGAQAYVRVQLSAGELLFCAHHATRHEEKLRKQAVAWHDETSRLHGEKAAAGQPAE